MKQYLDLCRKTLDQGVWKTNRTGTRTKGIIGGHMQFDLAEGFPAVTTKRLAIKTCIAEMLGFLRGYDNAKDFRDLGCNVWDANANQNKTWLGNPNRVEEDDLGRIYGVQARQWFCLRRNEDNELEEAHLDQLQMVIGDLVQGIDNRREIVTHWNPGELSEMALPPCHLFYQFGIQGDTLCLSMYQRSCDMPLGVPFNIAGYAWLLMVIAKITGLRPGVFNHFLHDIHVYENQIELLEEQLTRTPAALPVMEVPEDLKTLEDLETWVRPQDFHLVGYKPHDAINYPFSV